MSFDADAYLKAVLEPPAILIDGVTYEGRLLSLEEWLPFQDRLAALQEVRNKEDPGAWRDVYKIVRDYCNLAFPEKWWCYLMPWRKTVADRVLELPPVAMLAAVQDFFVRQARALRFDAGAGASQGRPDD